MACCCQESCPEQCQLSQVGQSESRWLGSFVKWQRTGEPQRPANAKSWPSSSSSSKDRQPGRSIWHRMPSERPQRHGFPTQVEFQKSQKAGRAAGCLQLGLSFLVREIGSLGPTRAAQRNSAQKRPQRARGPLGPRLFVVQALEAHAHHTASAPTTALAARASSGALGPLTRSLPSKTAQLLSQLLGPRLHPRHHRLPLPPLAFSPLTHPLGATWNPPISLALDATIISLLPSSLPLHHLPSRRYTSS